MSVAADIFQTVCWLFLLLLIFRLVMDYVMMFARSYQPKGPMLVAVEITYTITDPPIKALRRVIPPLRFGGAAIDLSFLVLFLLVQVLIMVAGQFA